MPVASSTMETTAAIKMMAVTTRSSVLCRKGWLRSSYRLIYTKMPGAYRMDMSVTPTAPDAHAKNTL